MIKKPKIYAALLCSTLALSGCFGHSAKDSQVTGQVIKAMKKTPMVYPDYLDVEVSLGVMKNGVGSMSTQDKWFYVPTEELFNKLKYASENGKLVKVTYDTARTTWYAENDQITAVEILP